MPHESSHQFSGVATPVRHQDNKILQEQKECADYLLSDGPDKAGARMGLADWTAEEVLERTVYQEFLEHKAQSDNQFGFEPLWLPSSMFDFQQFLGDWSIRKGRSAVLADCGLGKTLIELTWSENIVRKTNKPVLILTPLGVAPQTVREGAKFGIECKRSLTAFTPPASIIIANYERLHHFDPLDFAGVVCDESSILKSFDGKRRAEITEFMRTRPYRLLCTATAAPNDYIELGTSSECLGELGHLDMLNRFFKNDQNTIQPMRHHIIGKNFRDPKPLTEKWRFKGHAEIPFWRWVCSWARAARRPSDLGFDDGRFILPELIERQHLVKAMALAPGMLFSVPAIGLKEQREERRRTVEERCERVAELVEGHNQSLIWCHLNDEGDFLEQIVKDSVQVAGKDSDEAKEERFLAFADGQIKRLITKYKMGGFGMNWQQCAHMTTFPSHSYEQYYQGVRRCWRFGQKRPVTVDIVTTEGEQTVLENMQRKAAAADKMFSSLIAETRNAMSIERRNPFTEDETIPAWL